MQRTKSFQGFPWGVMVLCTIVLYATTIVIKYKTLDSSLGDTDDAMRLVQLREYLQHGSWFDLHTSRVGGAEGYTTHWSRIPDAIMALIFRLIQPFTSSEIAEKVTRIIYPGLWITIPAVASSLFAYWFTGNRLVVIIMVLLFALNPATFVQFGAGRIDHHNAQIAFAVLAILTAAMQRQDFHFAVVSGFSIGLMFTIGLEALPFGLVAAGAVAVNYAVYEDGKEAARGFAAALVLSTLFGFAISFLPSQYSQTACDALSSNLVVAVSLGSVVLYVWSMSSKLSQTVSSRCIGLVIAAGCAVAIYAVKDPACLSCPFGHINPAVKPLWLNKVEEMQPLLKWGSLAPNVGSLRFVYILILAIPATAMLLLVRHHWKNFALLVVISGFALSIVLGALNTRMSTYVTWFATPLICLAITHLITTLGRLKLMLSFAVMAVFSPTAILFWVTALSPAVKQNKGQEKIAVASCSTSQNYEALAALPSGLILAEVDLGPYILALTKHSVVAAPYHRLSDKIIEVVTYFDAAPSTQSFNTAKKLGADYVLFCWPEYTTNQAIRTTSLMASLHSGIIPPWLQPVQMPKGNPLVLFKLIKSDVITP